MRAQLHAAQIVFKAKGPGDKETLEKLAKKSVAPTQLSNKCFFAALREAGINYTQAPFVADAQLALMLLEKDIQHALTSDNHRTW